MDGHEWNNVMSLGLVWHPRAVQAEATFTVSGQNSLLFFSFH